MKSNTVLFLGVGLIIVLFVAFMLLPVNPESESTDDRIGSLDIVVPEGESSLVIPKEFEILLSTNRYSFYPNDEVGVEVIIKSPESIEDADIDFYGVKNKFGSYKMKRSLDGDLVPGSNVIRTYINVPSCSSCSGIDVPAPYAIYVSLSDENGEMLVNASAEIEILEELE